MRQITWLTGEYANVNDRQDQAAKRGCAITIDFHFNGNGPDAKGGEVWYKPGDAKAKALGQAILDTFSSLGLPFHGDEPLKEAVLGNRASFIRHYRNPAILIEPLFVTNPAANQAGWIHKKGNVQTLARKIAKVLEAATTDENSLIGLSIGHIYKPSSQGDTGVDCVRGDTEADHARAVAEAVGSILTGAPVTAPPWPPTRLKPTGTTIATKRRGVLPVANAVLKSDLLKGNNTLEAVANGRLVLDATGDRVEGIGPVQDALNQLGFTINLGSSGRFKGFFGEKTKAAVKAFQASANIDVDGRVGPDTIKKLDERLIPAAPARQPKASPKAAKKPAAGPPTPSGKFVKTRVKVLNRGIPPVDFLQELVAWGKTASADIFVDKQTQETDVYASVKKDLGPFNDILYRKAGMLEVMRVLAGFESSWKWNMGRDTTNPDENSPDTISAGPFQVSANSMGFGQDLRDLVAPHGIRNAKRDGDEFQALMKTNHTVAFNYISRLLRHTIRHNGPVKRCEINRWLSRDAAKEFQQLLTA
jgi:putative peptidoglycan binding protein/N-acetylmuramoyl-L-alanine amidase-like protein